MSEHFDPSPDDNARFYRLVEGMALPPPTIGNLLRDAQDSARQISASLTGRFSELEAFPDGYSFHDVPIADGFVRYAITPPDTRYMDPSSPVWRVIINRGQTVYRDTQPVEQWDLTDVLVQPGSRRLSVRTDQIFAAVGYGEITPLTNTPPRITRNAGSNQYSLSHAQGYEHILPEPPMFLRRARLDHYQTYMVGVGWLMHKLQPLSVATQVEGNPNLQRNDDS